MLYSYTAVDRSGQTISNSLEAGSERDLADKLRAQNILLLEVSNSRAIPLPKWQKWFGFLTLFLVHVSLAERMTFARNLAVMVGAGLSMMRALEALEAQTVNPGLKRIIRDLRESILKGHSLAEALKPHERIFGTLFINMVESGELSGTLEKVLTLLSRQMRHDYEIRSRVRGAMIYPAIIVAALIGVGTLMMIYVVPTLTSTFRELGVDLPFSTRLIIGVSEAITNHGFLILALVAAAGILFWRILKTSSGRSAAHRLLLILPIFGPLFKKFNSARFARTISSLISSGLPITRSLEVAAGVLGNVHFRDAVNEAAQRIQRGSKLAEILAEHPELFPPVVTQMVAVGEESGNLSRMLLRLAIFYEDEVTALTKNLSSIIEPLLMIVIGGAVGFFALSMLQPIYSGLGNL